MMETHKFLNIVVVIASTAMFLFQVIIAIGKLQNPPILDSSEIIDITEIELPVIYICPNASFTKEKTKEHGYDDIYKLLAGISSSEDHTGSQKITFKGKNDTTFWQMMEDMSPYWKKESFA